MGRKKERELLRPLTEKEIQQKLYGNYFDDSPAKPATQVEFLEAPPRKARFIFGSCKKISFSSLWRQWPAQITPLLSKGAKILFYFSTAVLQRTTTSWGLGLVIAAFLFMSIYALNEYRAKAMKAAKPTISGNVLGGFSLKKPPLRTAAPPIVESSHQVTAVEVPLPAEKVPPPEEQVQEVPPPSPAKKLYVIQVCIYSREEDAERLVEKMNQVNLPAFHRAIHRPGAKTFYPVFLGRFESFPDAQSALQQFRKKPIAQEFSDSFIRTL